MWHLQSPGHRVLHQLQQLSRVGPLRAGQAFRAALEVDSARIQPGAPNSTEGMDGPIDTSRPAVAAGGYPNAAPADQGYANQGYADGGYGGQGYYNPGYDQGAYYPGGAGYAPTLEQPGYTDMSCPSCGTINPDTRRFCSHCGYAFFYGGLDPYAGYYTSPASQAAQDRAARKAYRRSLPPLYRWRRVIIGVAVAALLHRRWRAAAQ